MSSAINEIALRSPVASVNNGAHLRVYTLANDGSVRETLYESGWSGGKAANTVGTLKLTSPLAAASLKLDMIRVYGVGDDNSIKEITYDKGQGWGVGQLTGKFAVAPYSSVAAVFLTNKVLIRVYAQSPDDTIQEWSWSNNSKGWYKDKNLGAALPGTSIAAVTWGESGSEIGIRVYYQDTSLNVIEKAYDAGKGWQTGELRFSVPIPRTSLAAVAWNRGANIRLYWGSADNNKVKEKAHDSPSWYDGGFAQAGVPGTLVSVLTVGGSSLRVYLQNGTGVTAFTEFMWGPGGWGVGYKALPPA